MAPKKGNSNPRKQYFDSIKSQKIDSLRWCLRHGGMTIKTENDDEEVGLQIAAAGGYAQSMEVLLEYVRKTGSAEDIEVPDEDGRTPLMLACYNGKYDCVRLLVLEGKAKLTTKCENGKTAMDYAVERRQDRIIAFLKDPKKPEPEPELEEEDEEEEARKRVFKASQKLSTQAAGNKQDEVYRARVEAAEKLEKELASAAPPVWPEVEAVLKETRRELSVRGKPGVPERGPVDPAVWGCVCLYELRLELADKVLTSLPGAGLARLTDLVTLIVSGNALAELPDELGTLTKLRNLEAAGNALTELPASAAKLTQLQVVDVSNNAIASLAPLSALESLVSVNAGSNKLTALDLAYESLEHLGSLAAPNNEIAVFPRGLGCCQLLTSVDFASNKIEQVPIELGNLTVKKLQQVVLKDNPLKDARIRRFVEDDSPTLVKDLLNHVRKNGWKGDAPAAKGGKKGKGKKGKGQAAAAPQEEDDSDGDANIAELLAAMNKGSGDDSD